MVLANGLVAVTGASGYIGSWCVKYLVNHGYHARGSVRSLQNTSKVQHLIDMKEIVELFEADLMVKGSFDACFTGCSAVFHVASPVLLKAEDAQKDILEPAVQGTLNVLETCKRVGVKRVVLTSSVAAIKSQSVYKNPEKFKDKIFTEVDWNTESTIDSAYHHSKVLAEKAAWDFCEKNDITLTVICPNLVIGPPLSTRLDTLSVGVFLQILNGAFIEDGIFNYASGCVDVRDVAKAHVLSLEKEGAQNQRFIVGGQNALDFLQLISYFRLDQRFANLKMVSKFTAPVVFYARYDNSKTVKVLGMKFRPPVTAILELGDFFVKNGLFKLPEGDDCKLSIE